MAPRAIIAEDELLLRQGLERLLVDGGIDVVASASDAADLVRKTKAHRPDVVVTDDLPGNLGLNWAMSPAVNGCGITGDPDQVLNCILPSVGSGESVAIHVVSPTTPATCGLIENRAILATGDPVLATVTVNCPAVQVLKTHGLERLAHHNALTVVEVDGQELETHLAAVAGQGLRGVADQDVHLARLQGGEALAGGQGAELDLRRVAKNGGCNRAAEVNVKPKQLPRQCRRSSRVSLNRKES